MILCPKCDHTMEVVSKEPLKDNWENRTYKCPKCGKVFELEVLPCAVDSGEDSDNV